MTKLQYWLIKSEPYVYSYAQLEADGQTTWTGVRNFEARNHLRAMQPGDFCLYYHSNEGKAVVGVARVLSAASPDPTAPKEDWAAVDVAPVVALKQPVQLADIKADPALQNMQLLTRSRLSVIPVSAEHFRHILKRAKTSLPKS